jgi:hypothetical protein
VLLAGLIVSAARGQRWLGLSEQFRAFR